MKRGTKRRWKQAGVVYFYKIHTGAAWRHGASLAVWLDVGGADLTLHAALYQLVSRLKQHTTLCNSMHSINSMHSFS